MELSSGVDVATLSSDVFGAMSDVVSITVRENRFLDKFSTMDATLNDIINKTNGVCD